MYAKNLQWYLGIISWSRTYHPGVSSSEDSPLRFPQITCFRRDPPTRAELWRDWPCCVWGSISRGMAPATLSGKHSDLSPAPPHTQILRQKQKNPASLQPWTPFSLSPRTARLHQIGVWVLVLVFIFKNHFQSPEQWAALYYSSLFLNHCVTLLTLLVPCDRRHPFEGIMKGAFRQCQIARPHGLTPQRVTPTFPCTSVLVTTCWDRSSQSPGSRSPGPYHLFSLRQNASVWYVYRFFNAFHKV